MYVIAEDRESGRTVCLGRPQMYETTEPMGGRAFGKRRKVWRYYSIPPAGAVASPFFKNVRCVETIPEGVTL